MLPVVNWYRGMVVSDDSGTGKWLFAQRTSSHLPVPGVGIATVFKDQPASHRHLPVPVNRLVPGDGWQ